MDSFQNILNILREDVLSKINKSILEKGSKSSFSNDIVIRMSNLNIYVDFRLMKEISINYLYDFDGYHYSWNLLTIEKLAIIADSYA